MTDGPTDRLTKICKGHMCKSTDCKRKISNPNMLLEIELRIFPKHDFEHMKSASSDFFLDFDFLSSSFSRRSVIFSWCDEKANFSLFSKR